MVARLFTPITVNGSVPFGDEGAALYSHRRPYVIVNVLVAFHVSWPNKLQFEKVSCTSGVLDTMTASGSLLARTFDNERKTFSTV
jgi:hypothetical protein